MGLSEVNGFAAHDDASRDDKIRGQLRRVVGSAAFRDSLRLTRFLTYIVEATLAGGGDRIKAYTVAVEALGRGANFDPQTDAIVRVEAGRLRSALARYYSGEGQSDPLAIELPRGTYVPTFRRRDAEPGENAAAKSLSREADLRSDPSIEISGRRRQLGLSLVLLQEQLKIHRLQVAAVAAELASARETLSTSRALLRAADNYSFADLAATEPSQSAAPMKVEANGKASLPRDNVADAAAAFRVLDELGANLSTCRSPERVAHVILDAVIRLQRSDFGSVQLFDDSTGELVISAQRGFSREFLRPLKRLRAAAKGYLTGRAILARAPVVVKDVLCDAEYAPLRNMAAKGGYRAAQSTPLIASNGRLVGTVSTHFARPHTPSRFDMLMTELCARVAADAIARLPPSDCDEATDRTHQVA